MVFILFILFTAISLSATAQNIDSDENVPPICRSACAGVIDVGRRCNGWFDKDRHALACMCDSYGMPLDVPRCEVCVADYLATRNDNIDEDDYEDVSKLRSVCGFSTLLDSASASAAQPSATPTVLNHHLSGDGVSSKAVPLLAAAAGGVIAAVMAAL